MAIARKPLSKPAGVPDVDAEKFIAGAGGAPPASIAAEEPARVFRKPAMIRFDSALLARVDRAAKRRGISRSAWVQYSISKLLDDEEAA